MLDRVIDELVTSICSWRVDMGLMTIRDRSVTSTPANRRVRRRKSSVAHNASGTDRQHPSIEDFQSRYPEHMLSCPQTSLYPIFFFLMERWEARRAAAKQNAVTSSSESTDSQSQE